MLAAHKAAKLSAAVNNIVAYMRYTVQKREYSGTRSIFQHGMMDMLRAIN